MSERMGEDVARQAEARHDELTNERARLVLEGVDPADLEMPLRPEPANATVLPEHLRRNRPLLPPGVDLTEQRHREALDACVDLAKEVAQLRLRLDRAERERDEAKTQCRRLNRELDDTRFDLDTMRARRDELVDKKLALRAEIDQLRAMVVMLAESDQAIRSALAPGQDECIPLERISQLHAELERLRVECDQTHDYLDRERSRRGWIVARDGGRGCERCEGEIRRGEAYELLPGTGGLLQHIHCPDLRAVAADTTEPTEGATT